MTMPYLGSQDLALSRSIAKRYSRAVDGLQSATNATALQGHREVLTAVVEMAELLMEAIYGPLDPTPAEQARQDAAMDEGVYTMLSILCEIDPDEVALVDLPDADTLHFRSVIPC